MARSTSESFAPIAMVVVAGFGVWLLSKRNTAAPVAYDAFGNPVSPAYGVGSLSPPVYGAGQADTIPNIINAFGNLFRSTGGGAAGGYPDGGGPALVTSLPIGPASPSLPGQGDLSSVAGLF